MARRRSIRRTLVAAALLLLAGAIINVLVAWGCVLAAPRIFYGLRGQIVSADERAIYNRPGWTISDCFGDRTSTGFSEMVFLYTRQPPELSDNIADHANFHIHWQAGWPVKALRCDSPDDGTTVNGGLWLSGSPLKGGASRWGGPFPYLPVSPGFAVNTALYTVVLTLGFVGFRWTWRRLRHRPGTCRSCRYDLRGNTSGVCPECGGEA